MNFGEKLLTKTSKKAMFIGLLLSALLVITFLIRIQGAATLPVGQFTENDAYLFHWQAKIIAEQGHLPERDMHRWLPIGRDNRQMLSLYAYAIAYTHKAFPWMSLYHIQLYAPVLCFTLGLGGLFLFLQRCEGLFFAAIVGLILATLPGTIERSAAGFGDRDAWCWMLGTLAVTSYLWKEQIEPGWRRYIATGTSGFIVFLGGMSWEAFGLFLLIIIVIELYKFCTTDAEARLKEYLLWCLIFVPWLYIFSPAYRSGYGFVTHVDAFILLPPLTVLALRGTRCLLLHLYEPLRPHARKLACGLTLLAITAGAAYFFLQDNSFQTNPIYFPESRLRQIISELASPQFGYWTGRYGSVFVLGSLGLIAASLHFWKINGLPFALSLTLFTTTTFFRSYISEWIGDSPCDILFIVSLALIPCCFGIVCLRKKIVRNELLLITMLVWLFFWLSFARAGKRFDFFIGVPIAYGTTWLLWSLPSVVIEKMSTRWQLSSIPACVTIAILIPVLSLNPLGGHANRAVASAKWRQPTPGKNSMAQALQWMKKTLPQDAVVASNWGYGSQLNVLSGVNTIIDQDHFLPHWIHLYYRHVYCAQSAREALTYLKTHCVTHLILTEWELIEDASDFSNIGSDENADRAFKLIPFRIFPKITGIPQRLSKVQETPFLYVDTIENNLEGPPNFLTARLKNRTVVRLPYVAFQGRKRIAYKTSEEENTSGGVILYYDHKKRLKQAYYIPTLGWKSLAVRLYILGEMPEMFRPIYPTDAENSAPIKIWEIHYPPDIKADPKYLKTGVPEIDDTLHLQ